MVHWVIFIVEPTRYWRMVQCVEPVVGYVFIVGHLWIIKVDVFKYTFFTRMHLLFSSALSLAIWGWWATSPLMFYGGVFFSICLMMYIDISNSIVEDGFLDSAISIMDTTDCCLVHRLWSEPTSVRWTTVSFKILAGLTALCATYVSWQHRRSFIAGHYTLVSALWATTAALWVCSCIPMLVCLVQCADVKWNRKLS